MNCPYCGKDHPDGFEFCPETGKFISKILSNKNNFDLNDLSSVNPIQVEQNQFNYHKKKLKFSSKFLIASSFILFFVTLFTIFTLILKTYSSQIPIIESVEKQVIN